MVVWARVDVLACMSERDRKNKQAGDPMSNGTGGEKKVKESIFMTFQEILLYLPITVAICF